MSIKKIPCGGFYVNDYAVEMIDGKPVLKTSGNVEVLDNAKATGGIGWTDEDNTVHKIDKKYLPVIIPVAPSVDGTYTLTCTVTDGAPVYSWESSGQ